MAAARRQDIAQTEERVKTVRAGTSLVEQAAAHLAEVEDDRTAIQSPKRAVADALISEEVIESPRRVQRCEADIVLGDER